MASSAPISEGTGTPPPFVPHVVELESVEDSKITNVAVYSGRAEVTRVFRFSVNTGQNQVHINGLPNVTDYDSLRVEGKGMGTIQEVSISPIQPPEARTTSPRLKELLREQKLLEQSSYRAKQTLKSLDDYLGSLDSKSTPSSQLRDVLADYNSNIKDAQAESLSIEDKLDEIQGVIKEEREKLEGKKRNLMLSMKASVGVFAAESGEIELGLVYAVTGASWSPKYDIRVDTQTKEKAITLVYKGSLTQNTGEDWTDVPLVLETATPTFDKSIPHLYPWRISINHPERPIDISARVNLLSERATQLGTRRESASASRAAPVAFSMAPPPPPHMPMPEMSVRGANISSKSGNVSATFSVPGKMTIPSDASSHNVTIVQLNLDAKMTWVSVPKMDTRVHLNAKIKNSSEFVLLAGPASVYVDGSFISRSNVPAVSPDESFDCPLGLDPAIKVSYHPRIKKLSKSGLLSKSDVRTFTQRITVHNTKSINVDNVKLVDQIHVSEDAAITVKLISPALQLPGTSSDAGSILSGKSGTKRESSGSSSTKFPAPVKVASGVTAKWDYGGEEEENVDVASLGKNGKLNFICALPPQGKTNLTLQWEVAAPAKTDILGL